jgi:hypothetical protein
VKDEETIAAANRLEPAMVFTGVPHFRHEGRPRLKARLQAEACSTGTTKAKPRRLSNDAGYPALSVRMRSIYSARCATGSRGTSWRP